MSLEQRLLNIDFSNKETKERLKSLFKEDIFKDEKDANFVSFLERLQDEIKSGHTEVFKSVVRIREKIKKGQLLTQGAINIAQSLDLHHWKGSNVQGRTFSTMHHVDFRDAKANFTTIQGDLSDSIWSNLMSQKIEGNNHRQEIEGSNWDQKIGGDNKSQEIKENNYNQEIKGDNESQEIVGFNGSQKIGGANKNQEIKNLKIQKIGGANYKQIIGGDNVSQKIRGDNKNQEIGGDNVSQKIRGKNIEQIIGGKKKLSRWPIKEWF